MTKPLQIYYIKQEPNFNNWFQDNIAMRINFGYCNKIEENNYIEARNMPPIN